MSSLAKPIVSRQQAIILVLAMAVIGVIFYLYSFAGSGNTITVEGCTQIGGQLDTTGAQCSKNGVVFDIVKSVK